MSQFTSTPVPAAFAALANKLADSGGAILRQYFRKRIDVISKSDESPVTQADRECEAQMRTLIKEAYPDHGIAGEEYGIENRDAEYLWVLDPLDGTKAFVTGRPLFGILIALLHRGTPILGIIDMPILKDRWIGLVGQPTTLNGQPVAARACANLTDAYISSISPHIFDADSLARFERVRKQAKLTTYGGDCYQYAMVATGFLDLVIEDSLVYYDYLALQPILEGAGGIITDWHGKKLTMDSGPRIIAAGDKAAHRMALALLNS